MHSSPPGVAAVTSGEHGAEVSAAAASSDGVPHVSSSRSLNSSTSAQDLKRGGSGENAAGSKRPKDRKKRGRDVYKEVLKQERKKSASSSAPSTSQHPSGSTSLLQVQTTSGSKADASRSRSRSSSRARSHSRSISKSRSHSRLRTAYE